MNLPPDHRNHRTGQQALPGKATVRVSADGMEAHLTVTPPGEGGEPIGLPQALAALTARRVSTTTATTNLLPPEYAKRYKQQFVDRLWMRSLGAILMLYIFGVVIYIGFVQFASFRYDSTVEEARGLSQQYTNALQLKEKLRVLQDTLELQYAIRKRITSENRIKRQREFLMGSAGSSLRATYFSDPLSDTGGEPFAFLHRPV